MQLCLLGVKDRVLISLYSVNMTEALLTKLNSVSKLTGGARGGLQVTKLCKGSQVSTGSQIGAVSLCR